MLVLRRKVGETLVLAGVIKVSVLAVEGGRVKIGITAPPDVEVVREELLRVSNGGDGTHVVPEQNAPMNGKRSA